MVGKHEAGGKAVREMVPEITEEGSAFRAAAGE